MASKLVYNLLSSIVGVASSVLEEAESLLKGSSKSSGTQPLGVALGDVEELDRVIKIMDKYKPSCADEDAEEKLRLWRRSLVDPLVSELSRMEREIEEKGLKPIEDELRKLEAFRRRLDHISSMILPMGSELTGIIRGPGGGPEPPMARQLTSLSEKAGTSLERIKARMGELDQAKKKLEECREKIRACLKYSREKLATTHEPERVRRRRKTPLPSVKPDEHRVKEYEETVLVCKKCGKELDVA